MTWINKVDRPCWNSQDRDISTFVEFVTSFWASQATKIVQVVHVPSFQFSVHSNSPQMMLGGGAVSCAMQQQYESSLFKVIKGDAGGNFGKMISYSLMETDAFGAEIYTIATKGDDARLEHHGRVLSCLVLSCRSCCCSSTLFLFSLAVLPALQVIEGIVFCLFGFLYAPIPTPPRPPSPGV